MIPGTYAVVWTWGYPWAKTDDHNVWGLLVVGPVARFFSFVAAGIMDVFNWHEPEPSGYQNVWLGILAWLAVGIMVGVCAVGLDRLPPTIEEVETRGLS